MSKVQIYYNKTLCVDLIENTFNASFPVKFNREYWNWRFLNNPNSEKTYIAYIEENGVLAAYYAVSPMKIRLNGKDEKIALSNMTMTHPDFRGKGFFKLLAKALFDSLKENGFIGVFGFANHNSHYGFRKYLNWTDLSSLNVFSVNADAFRNINIRSNEVILSIEEITKDVLSTISDLVTNKNLIHIIRDQSNIEWRLKNNPINDYKVQVGKMKNKIVSMLFYKKYKAEIDIMEFFFDNSMDRHDLLNYNISELVRTTNSTINIWSNLHSDEHINLEKQGFQETNFNTYFGIIPFVKEKELLDYRKWHFRFLDSDIF